eukprot:10188175-Alexandrium_andersonii.AAC.1
MPPVCWSSSLPSLASLTLRRPATMPRWCAASSCHLSAHCWERLARACADPSLQEGGATHSRH